MLGSKRFVPLLLSSLFAGTSAAALAGSSSPLDMNLYMQPPARTQAQRKQSGQADGKFDGQTYVSTPSIDGDSSKTYLPHGDKSARETKPVKSAKHSNIAHGVGLPGLPKLKLPGHKAKAQAEPQPLMAELAPAPKHSQSALEHNAKPSRDGFADNKKGLGESIASTAKSSSSFFVKGAKALGQGIKSGSEAVGSKVASVSPFGHSDSNKKPSSKSATDPGEGSGAKTSFGQSTSESMQAWDSNRQIHTAPTQDLGAQVKSAGAPPRVATSRPGLFGKTMSKIPFLGHNKSQVAGNSPRNSSRTF